MKINNRDRIKKNVVWLMIFIFTDAVFLFVFIILGIESKLLFIISGVPFLLLLWRLFAIRIFDIEITEYVLVIKYQHPFLTKHRHPILELPTITLYDLQIENSMTMSFFRIVISKKNKYKTFCYRLDVISKNQITLLETAINSLLDTDRNSNFLNYDS